MSPWPTMGCSSSSSVAATEVETSHPNTPVLKAVTGGRGIAGGLPVDVEVIQSKASETIAQAYQRLDEEICALESTCPGPRLLTAEAWVEHLRTVFERESAAVIVDGGELALNVKLGEIPNGIPEAGEAVRDLQGPEEAVLQHARDDTAKLALKLDVAFDPAKATRQEEFLGRVSRSAMQLEAVAFRSDMVDHAGARAANLRQSFSQLKTLYLELDHLLISANNGNYTTLQEQRLDGELESAREVRDRLGGVSEQWRLAGSLIRVSAKGLQRAVEYWNLVGLSQKAEEKIALALDCRTACHGALITLEAAQAALPQVDIPHVTMRQQTAVKHGLVYMLTDMANSARFQHTKHVLEGFLANVHQSVSWVHDTFKETLQKDLSEADQTVMLVAKQLREIRKHYLSQRFGSKIYVKPTMGKLQQR